MVHKKNGPEGPLALIVFDPLDQYFATSGGAAGGGSKG
jgi:hypothetical protein